MDVHEVLVAAPADAVWRSLARQVVHQKITGNEVLARVLDTAAKRASGTALAEGATVPGFTVAESSPGERLRLVGRHRFSRYALVFTLAPRPTGTVLAAHTYAEFPGMTGFVYRRLVIGSGAHRLLVRRMLRSVRHHAETDGAR
ncbi:hypothetical protein [Actinacidiphila acidipaludis]|uniref:hypothetical protein n=1 Tax=Actinacidiphila acidipaludis TaxID=2873382 RepID=UPI0027DFAAB6|nr:hypothetical protein [Streptomyces acidipaludis]